MAHNIPMATATLLSGIPEFVQAELGDRALRRAYSDAGLQFGVTASVRGYIPEASLVGMMESAARQAGDGFLGALFGLHVNVGVYDTWGGYVIEAKTLGKSLQRLSRVMRYVASHAKANLVVRDHEARLNFRWGMRKPLGYRQICLATVSSLVNTIRKYAGPSFVPDEIHLDIARPADGQLEDRQRGARLYFDAPEISVRFPSDLLDLHRRSATDGVLTSLSDVRRRVLSGPPEGIETSVSEMIRLQVLNGAPSLEQTARAFDMNIRTLRRILDRQGESFRDMANRIRLETAEELLIETDMSIRAVAQAVGYSDPYNFSRAFNGRYGYRPTAVRKS